MNEVFNTLSIANLTSWLILGTLAGFVAHLIDRRDVQGGAFSTIVTGIVGALVGGSLTNMFFGVGISGLNLTSLIIATGGALLLSIIQRMLFGIKQESFDVYEGYNERIARTYNPAYYSQVTPLSNKEQKRSNPSYQPFLAESPEVQEFLGQVEYPISKRDLLRHTEQHDAREEVLTLLEQLPDHIYDSSSQITQELEKI